MNPELCLVIFQHAVTDKEKMKFVSSKANKHTKVKGFTLHFSPKKILLLFTELLTPSYSDQISPV